jgi:CYTH domain-containing protein
MDKTYRTELRRVFLIADLPEPLTRASQHLQIFDNYIENTRLRLRSIRSPETKKWTWILQQRISLEDLSQWKISEIYLNESEHAAFEIFEGREIRKNEKIQTNEIRKNRYFYDFANKEIAIDVFLGELWGLHLAKVFFVTIEEMQNFTVPLFAILEVTNNEFFRGKNLVGKTFADVKTEFNKKG